MAQSGERHRGPRYIGIEARSDMVEAWEEQQGEVSEGTGWTV